MIFIVPNVSDPRIGPSDSAARETERAQVVPVRTIEALITLLRRESNPANVAVVRRRLVDLGTVALPWLDRAAEHASDPAGSTALEIRRRLLDAEWRRWASQPIPDLESGVLLINRFGDPSVNEHQIGQSLDGLADELRRRLIGRDDPDTIIAILTGYLFGDVGLRGNNQAYEDPENSYLSDVLARKLGIPVSLSVVVLLVARRVELPIVGIGMPGHFLLRYGPHEDGLYLDAFGGGRRLSSAQCAEWLHSSGVEFTPRMLRPVSSREIVARMVRNLIAVFNPRDIGSEAEILSGYLDITKRSAVSPATTRSRV